MDTMTRIALLASDCMKSLWPEAKSLPEAEELRGLLAVPPDPALGDYAFPCFRLAKALRMAPPKIAEALCAAWTHENVASVQPVNGYMNFFLNRANFAAETMAALQAQGVDLIVCICHSGLEKDPDTGKTVSDTGEHVACLLCEQLPIDLMLTGHQHVPMVNKTWAGAHVVQTSCNAMDYIRVTLSGDGVFHSELCPVTPPGEISAGEPALWEGLQRFLARPVGRLSRPLRPAPHLRMAFKGSDIADFFNAVMLWASGADLSCAALANQVKGFEEVVTVRDVIASYPYANTLTVLSVDGRTLRLALEQCARYFETDETGCLRVSDEYLKPKQAHYNYDYYAGLTYAFDLSRPAGHRVTKMERNGRPIQDGDTFSLCMCNYRATGAGHYDFFASLPRLREIQTEVSELILDYLREHPALSLPDRHSFTVTGGRLPDL